MKTINKFIIILLLSTQNLFAQQDPMYTQYWVNPQILNPAQAGAEGKTILNLTGRHQWVNVKGAPRTYSISLNGLTKKHLGIGVSYLLDRVGPSITHTANADVSYYIQLSENFRFSGGVRLTGLVNKLDFTDFYTITPNDPAFMTNISSGLKPNAGIGFLLSSRRFYMGYAQPRIMNYEFGSKSALGTTHILQHRFTYVGYNFNINKEVKFRPSVLIKQVENAPVQADINTAFEYKEKLITGLSVRTRDGIGLLLGINDLAGFDFYYCYDYPLTSIALVSKQTHQFTISYPISGRDISRINSPRYFN